MLGMLLITCNHKNCFIMTYWLISIDSIAFECYYFRVKLDYTTVMTIKLSSILHILVIL